MRIILLLSTMLLATVAQPCLAQSHDGAAAAATVDVTHHPTTRAVPGATAPKSAFGRVMAVLIAKLVQDSTRESQSRKAAGSDTSTLPIDIEVGAAFRPDAVVATNARDENAQAPPLRHPGTMAAPRQHPFPNHWPCKPRRRQKVRDDLYTVADL